MFELFGIGIILLARTSPRRGRFADLFDISRALTGLCGGWGFGAVSIYKHDGLFSLIIHDSTFVCLI